MSTSHPGSRDPLETLARLDLNLLLAFDALAREANVTRAAQRLGVTQSAMSHTLRRLRTALDDPLFVRAGGVMAMTPRAAQMATPLRAALRALGRAVSDPPHFEPSTSERVFRMSAPDLFEIIMAPHLLTRLHTEAPGVDLIVAPADPSTLARDLASGDIDVAVIAVAEQQDEAVMSRLEGSGLVRRTLFRDPSQVFARRGHPGLQVPLTPETYARLSHILVSPRGQGPGIVEAGLQARGLTRRIAFRTPSFAVAAAVAARTDLVITAPSVLAALSTASHPLTSRELPLDVPTYSLALAWHERLSADPPACWLRDLITDVSTHQASVGWA